MLGRECLRWTPRLTLLVFLGPVLAGLAGTLLPSFGYLPVIGARELGLEPWRGLLALPGLGRAVALSLWTGFAATLLSFVAVVGFVACAQGPGARLLVRAQHVMAPMLATPHAAVAIGLAFVIAPSGWLARLVSPWLTGWQRPPDMAFVADPLGLGLIVCLMLKEVPFLLLMTVGALGQVRAERTMAVARSLGYAGPMAWLKAVLPQVYPQLRLPLYAVLAFSLSVVDVSLILGPRNPPTLAVYVLRLLTDPDITMLLCGAAGATLQLALAALAVGLWRLGELLCGRLARPLLTDGRTGVAQAPGVRALGRPARLVGQLPVLAVGALAALGAACLALWSVTRVWRYPWALPQSYTLAQWQRHLEALAEPALTTVVAGAAATLVSLTLVLGCLENEAQSGEGRSGRALWLVYIPLLIPQIAFLFGCQALFIRLGLANGWPALVWSHILFVLPYVFLALSDPWRALDGRYARAAAGLGAPPWRVFWRIKLPLLARPLAFAMALGFAVSVDQYLPTLFAGGGRFATLTTEAVALASGGDRRVIAVYAFVQAALPLAAFGLALGLTGRGPGKPGAASRKRHV